MKQLSENFSLEEFEKSNTASAKGIDNSVPAELIGNIQALVDNVLQPLRDLYGKPISFNSGYRCEELNKAVGGVSTSQHKKGEAGDLTCESVKVLYDTLVNSEIDFDQAIFYRKRNFLHVSYDREVNRKEIILK